MAARSRNCIRLAALGALALGLLAGCRGVQRGEPADREAPAPDIAGSLQVGGRERTYLLHLPPGYEGAAALPLVLVLHGGGGNAANAAAMSGMSARADREGFIAAYPNGSGRQADRLLTWNAGTCCGWALDQGADDVGFIRALIRDLAGRYKVDPRRIYVAGMSNGGMLAHRLACELAGTIAAAAPVAGALTVPECRPARPVPMIIFHGTADQHVLYEGGPPRKTIDSHPRVDASVADAVAFWTAHNRCPAAPATEERDGVVKDIYAGCQDGADVVLYSIRGGGHAWPGGERGRESAGWLGDEPSAAIAASDLMWEFFARHPRP